LQKKINNPKDVEIRYVFKLKKLGSEGDDTGTKKRFGEYHRKTAQATQRDYPWQFDLEFFIFRRYLQVPPKRPVRHNV